MDDFLEWAFMALMLAFVLVASYNLLEVLL